LGQDLVELELTKEQQNLVGKGYTGPPAAIDGITLSAEQVLLSSFGIESCKKVIESDRLISSFPLLRTTAVGAPNILLTEIKFTYGY
jgi:hypothetical protein